MNLTKFNFWIIGTAVVIMGTLLLYFEKYRNSDLLETLGLMLVITGWMILFIKATKHTSITAPKVIFRENWLGWFKQKLSNLFYFLILFALGGGNIYCAENLADIRRDNILNNQPTKTTIAIVDHIEARRHKNSTSYYAVFTYTANGVLTTHPWYESDEGDFLVGEKYMVKYSVEHPEMMMILQKMPGDNNPPNTK